MDITYAGRYWDPLCTAGEWSGFGRDGEKGDNGKTTQHPDVNAIKPNIGLARAIKKSQRQT